jgi:hypothetical protein
LAVDLLSLRLLAVDLLLLRLLAVDLLSLCPLAELGLGLDTLLLILEACAIRLTTCSVLPALY